jgi:hypothetical protein
MLRFILPLLLLPSPLLSEVFPLSKHGSWTISYQSPEPGMVEYCSAMVHTSVSAFAFNIRKDTGFTAWLYDPSVPWVKGVDGTIYLWTDTDHDPWEITAALLDKGAIIYIKNTAETTRFLTELEHSTALYVDYNIENGNGPLADAIFPIVSTTEALEALASCADKMSPQL